MCEIIHSPEGCTFLGGKWVFLTYRGRGYQRKNIGAGIVRDCECEVDNVLQVPPLPILEASFCMRIVSRIERNGDDSLRRERIPDDHGKRHFSERGQGPLRIWRTREERSTIRNIHDDGATRKKGNTFECIRVLKRGRQWPRRHCLSCSRDLR